MQSKTHKQLAFSVHCKMQVSASSEKKASLFLFCSQIRQKEEEEKKSPLGHFLPLHSSLTWTLYAAQVYVLCIKCVYTLCLSVCALPP